MLEIWDPNRTQHALECSNVVLMIHYDPVDQESTVDTHAGCFFKQLAEESQRLSRKTDTSDSAALHGNARPDHISLHCFIGYKFQARHHWSLAQVGVVGGQHKGSGYSRR